MAADDEAEAEVEYEVDDILRYRRNEDGSEYFMVKWVGFPVEEATWEPLAHMNDNCRELIAKARALFAWRRPGQPAARDGASNEVALSPNGDGSFRPELRQAPSHSSMLSTQLSSSSLGGGAEHEQVLIEDVEDADGGDTAASLITGEVDASLDAAPSKRPRLRAPLSSPASSPEESPAPSAPTPSAPLHGRPSTSAPPMPPIPEPAAQLEPPKAVWEEPASPEPLSPRCRLERIDEFHPVVGAGVLQHSFASSSSTFSMTFNASPVQWRKQQWSVHLRSVLCSGTEMSGPAWPHRVMGKLNGRQVVDIAPPKHLHIRREQCYNLTPLLKQGPNTLELKFTPKPDRSPNEPEESYCVGVVLTRPRAVQAIIQRIRSQSTETVASGRARVHRILAQVAVNEALQDECKVTGTFGRVMKPMCPVSHCPIEDAAIGRHCNHVQVFDLAAYIAVNQRMRSLDKRWTCPVCGKMLRPDEVILDPFAQGILDTMRGTEDVVDSIVFNEDCTWTTVNMEKDNGDDDDGAPGGGSAAELIDLSDSE